MMGRKVLMILLVLSVGAVLAGRLLSEVRPPPSSAVTAFAGEAKAAPTLAPAPDVAPQPVDLSSAARCGCKLTEATSYEQPDECVLKERPQLVGLDGYLKTDIPPADLPKAPWRVKELKQTGPDTWDPRSSVRMARTKVHVLQAIYTSDFSPLHGRLQVRDSSGQGAPFWIRIEDFDPVAWWVCPADKAVAHSLILAQPTPGSRPTTIEGRWIETTYKGPVWCWTWVDKVGVYCEPSLARKSPSFEPWIFRSDELTITY